MGMTQFIFLSANSSECDCSDAVRLCFYSYFGVDSCLFFTEQQFFFCLHCLCLNEYNLRLALCFTVSLLHKITIVVTVNYALKGSSDAHFTQVDMIL